jgi:hypothetical protein
MVSKSAARLLSCLSVCVLLLSYKQQKRRYAVQMMEKQLMPNMYAMQTKKKAGGCSKARKAKLLACRVGEPVCCR